VDDEPVSAVPSQVRLAPSGDIDLATVDELTMGCDRLLAQQPRRLVLDFAHVGLCDASGLGALARIYLDTLVLGCELILTNVNEHVRSVMGIVGFEQILTIEDA
jgi:anti-anti-sigma factor